jgi:hypothetical protein
MPPTSVRLTPAQEAELAALALDLAAARPDLADAARGGALTPGAVLRLALARGLRELRGDLAAAAADDDDAPLVLDPGPPPLPPRDPYPPVRLDPWEPEPIRPPAGAPLGEGAAAALAELDRALAEHGAPDPERTAAWVAAGAPAAARRAR